MLVGETTFAAETSFARESDSSTIWRPNNVNAITLYGAADHMGRWAVVRVPAEETGDAAQRRLLNDAAAAGLVARVA